MAKNVPRLEKVPEGAETIELTIEGLSEYTRQISHWTPNPSSCRGL